MKLLPMIFSSGFRIMRNLHEKHRLFTRSQVYRTFSTTVCLCDMCWCIITKFSEMHALFICMLTTDFEHRNMLRKILADSASNMLIHSNRKLFFADHTILFFKKKWWWFCIPGGFIWYSQFNICQRNMMRFWVKMLPLYLTQKWKKEKKKLKK